MAGAPQYQFAAVNFYSCKSTEAHTSEPPLACVAVARHLNHAAIVLHAPQKAFLKVMKYIGVPSADPQWGQNHS
jgi:hypothetical protein